MQPSTSTWQRTSSNMRSCPGWTTPGTHPRQLFKMMQAAITDFHVEVHDLLQDGEQGGRTDLVRRHPLR